MSQKQWDVRKVEAILEKAVRCERLSGSTETEDTYGQGYDTVHFDWRFRGNTVAHGTKHSTYAENEKTTNEVEFLVMGESVKFEGDDAVRLMCAGRLGRVVDNRPGDLCEREFSSWDRDMFTYDGYSY
jgi:hypothetical protein